MSDPDLTKWIGRTAASEDLLLAGPAQRLAATLDRDEALGEGDPLPPLWHWAYFLAAAPAARLGPDGHEARGAFLPPVPLPRRMFAGGRFRHDNGGLRVGDRARRVATVTSVEEKTGRSGPLVFVGCRFEFVVDGATRLVEERDIVYREAPAVRAGPAGHDPLARPEAPDPPREPAGPWRRVITPDPVLLFRYSAITFNGHRIHYDHPYVTRVEGYPGLVVHGPLIATLLADLWRDEAGGALTCFSFRARAPLFDTAGFTLSGGERGEDGATRLAAHTPDGAIAMEASAA